MYYLLPIVSESLIEYIYYFDFHIFNCLVVFNFFRDAVSCEKAVELAANTKGICYIRLSRPATEIIYDNEEEFAIGKL